MKRLAFVLALFGEAAIAAPRLVCHYSYGGETKTLSHPQLESVAQADGVKAEAIGSYFMFRPVFEPAEVKLYTYADAPAGPVLLHQASFTYPAATAAHGRYGFTGEQRVYEPIRDSELIYWCEIGR